MSFRHACNLTNWLDSPGLLDKCSRVFWPQKSESMPALIKSHNESTVKTIRTESLLPKSVFSLRKQIWLQGKIQQCEALAYYCAQVCLSAMQRIILLFCLFSFLYRECRTATGLEISKSTLAMIVKYKVASASGLVNVAPLNRITWIQYIEMQEENTSGQPPKLKRPIL